MSFLEIVCIGEVAPQQHPPAPQPAVQQPPVHAPEAVQPHVQAPNGEGNQAPGGEG